MLFRSSCDVLRHGHDPTRPVFRVCARPSTFPCQPSPSSTLLVDPSFRRTSTRSCALSWPRRGPRSAAWRTHVQPWSRCTSQASNTSNNTCARATKQWRNECDDRHQVERPYGTRTRTMPLKSPCDVPGRADPGLIGILCGGRRMETECERGESRRGGKSHGDAWRIRWGRDPGGPRGFLEPDRSFQSSFGSIGNTVGVRPGCVPFPKEREPDERFPWTRGVGE